VFETALCKPCLSCSTIMRHVIRHQSAVKAPVHCPLRLKSLRLEASVTDHGDMYHHGALLKGISSMVNLEKLHFHGFEELGQWPADVAAALRPLHHLQALVRLTEPVAAVNLPHMSMHEHQMLAIV
jgi:hypothetical protein